MNRLGAVSIACTFAAIWALYGLSHFVPLAAWRYVGLLPSVIIVARAALLPKQARSFDWGEVKSRYFRVVFAEVVALILVTNVLAATGRTGLIWPAIAVVVGLHFIPLASVFGSAIYYGTGVIIATLGALEPILPSSIGPLVLGLGAAATLWSTALLQEQNSSKQQRILEELP